MKQFTPYSANFFRADPENRINEVNNQGLSMYEILVRNLMAHIFFYESCVHPRLNKNVIDIQFTLMEAYRDGSLLTAPTNGKGRFPLLSFCERELRNLKNHASPSVQKYRAFIEQHMKVFQVIQWGTEFNQYKTGREFIKYLSDAGHSDLGKNVNDLFLHLNAYHKALIKELNRCLLNRLEISGFDKSVLVDHLHGIQHYIKNDLLTHEQQQYLMKLTYNWFSHMVKDTFFRMNIIDSSALISELQQDFYEATGYHPDLQERNENNGEATEEGEYPLHVFASYKAYRLFDDLASRLDKKAPISYIYRRMEKERLIHLNDSDFRLWFKQQSYPADLQTATETLERSGNTERCVMMSLLFKSYGLIQGE